MTCMAHSLLFLAGMTISGQPKVRELVKTRTTRHAFCVSVPDDLFCWSARLHMRGTYGRPHGTKKRRLESVDPSPTGGKFRSGQGSCTNWPEKNTRLICMLLKLKECRWNSRICRKGRSGEPSRNLRRLAPELTDLWPLFRMVLLLTRHASRKWKMSAILTNRRQTGLAGRAGQGCSDASANLFIGRLEWNSFTSICSSFGGLTLIQLHGSARSQQCRSVVYVWLAASCTKQYWTRTKVQLFWKSKFCSLHLPLNGKTRGLRINICILQNQGITDRLHSHSCIQVCTWVTKDYQICVLTS